MKAQFQPWQLLLLILAGWINRRQQEAVEYLLAENRILREKLTICLAGHWKPEFRRIEIDRESAALPTPITGKMRD